jgi:hypothetical protein
MTAFLLDHAGALKLAVAAGLLVGLAVAQWVSPMRGDASLTRWRVNLGVIAASTLATRLLIPASTIAVAVWTQAHGWGLLHRLAWSPALGFGFALVALDFAIY